MNTLYLDLFSGISGDMFIGALIDLGAEARQLERELQKLGLAGYHLHVSRERRRGIEGVKFDVYVADAHEHSEQTHGHSHSHSHEHGRTFAEIRQTITESQLSAWVKQKSVAVFQRIADAEGKIHGLPPDKVHFHEVGAVDSIVDIVGGCIALEMLGKPRVVAGAVVEGTGWVECAHGRFPVPAPATLAILGARGIAISQCDEPGELVTPTGAAVLAELVESFGPMRGLVAEKIGYGLGTRENQTRPNVLRAVLGESRTESQVPGAGAGSHDWETDTVAVLESNLDDISAELLGNFMDKALAAGALDVFHTAVQMKKSRPGVLLTVLCAQPDADRFAEMLMRETSTFGVRRHVAERRKLRREFVTVQTPHGAVTVKVGRLDGTVLQAAPEFETCRALADSAKVPVKEVYEAALRAFPPSLLE
jgi:pyridinium-3,5-bisthiocarboxylic acid mononucleotide nickel chelatase